MKSKIYKHAACLLSAVWFAVIFAMPFNAYATADPDLVGLWHFDGDWQDSSDNDNHGTGGSGASFIADNINSLESGSFSGDTSGYVKVANVAGFPSDEITIEYWVKSTNLSKTGTTFSYAASGGSTNELTLFNTRNIYIWLAGIDYGSTGINVNDGQWHHLALTWRSSDGRVQMFKDGTRAFSGTVAKGDRLAGGGTIVFAQDQDSVGGSFQSTQSHQGLMDEVAVYRRVLADEEIRERYNAGISSDKTPPVAPTIDPVPTPTTNYIVNLSGTKEAGSSIRINGRQVIAHDSSTTWGTTYSLSKIGENTLTITSHDVDGNQSEAVSVAVELLAANKYDPDLVGLWHMEGNWDDCSGNGHHATGYSGATFSFEPVTGIQAGNFDGYNDYAIVRNFSDFPKKEITFEYWVKTSKMNSNPAAFSYAVSSQNNELVVFNTGNIYVHLKGGRISSTGIAVNDGNWHHLAFTWQSSDGRMKIYKDGEFAYSEIISKGASIEPGGALVFAQDQDSVGGSFQTTQAHGGLLDEVKIYRRVLSDVEIRESYNTGISDDKLPPSAPVVNPVASPTLNNIVHLSGTKDADASICINGKPVVAYDSFTTWEATYLLPQLGVNNLAITSRDESGNQSEVVEVAIELLPANQSDPDIVGLWHMDGNWKDSSGNGNHGTGFNDAAFTSTGIAGSNAGSFDGADDYVNLGTSESLILSSSFSTSVWIYPQGEGQGQGIILNKEGEYEIAWFSDGIKFALANDIPEWDWIATNYIADLNKWTNLVWTYDANQKEIKLYANGELVFSTSGPGRLGDVHPNWDELRIGGRQGYLSYFKGQIDEVAIYKRALSAEEILHKYNQTILESQPPAKPIVDPVADVVGTNTLTITGTKEAGTSLWINGVKRTELDRETAWQVELDLAPGTNSFSVVVRNENGIESDRALVTVVYDNVAPFVESTFPVEGEVTNDSTVGVSFVLADELSAIDPAATVASATVIDEKGQSVAGTWDASVANRVVFLPGVDWADGGYSVSIQPTDIVGNASQAALSFSVDTIPPVPPVIDQVMPLVSDPTIISGTMADDASAVNVAARSGVVGTVAYPETGVWTVSVSEMAEGENVVSVYAVDVAGNQSDTATVTFVVDRTAPDAPLFDSVVTPTPSPRVLLSGTKEADTTLILHANKIPRYFDSATEALLEPFDSNSILSGEGLWDISEGLEKLSINDGKLEFYSDEQVDTYSRLNSKFLLSGDFDIQIEVSHDDYERPASSLHYGAILTIYSDKNNVSFGKFLNNSIGYYYSSPNDSWTSWYFSEGSTGKIRITRIGKVLRSYAWRNNRWEYNGNTSGYKYNSEFNDDVQVRIWFKQESGASVHFTADNFKINSADKIIWNDKIVSDESLFHGTTWSFDVPLLEGENTFDAYVEDAAKNHSNIVSSVVVRDTTPPSLASTTPAADAIIGSLDSIRASFTDEFSEIDLTSSLVGAKVLDNFGAAVQGRWTIDGGELVFSPSVTLPEGLYTVTLYPADTLGNTGPVSFSFTVDQGAPTAAALSMTPDSPHKAEAVKFTLIFSEAMDVSTAAVVSLNPAEGTSLSLSGAWQNATTWQGSLTFTEAMANGPYTVTVSGARDVAGNTMTAQQAGSFELDTVAPGVPTVVVTEPLTGLPSQLLTGSKEAGTSIVINGIERVALDGETTWSCTYPLSEGVNNLVVAARDAAGNLSGSAAASITLDTTPPLFTIDQYQPQSATATQTLAGRKEPGCLVTLDGDTIITEDDLEGTWSYEVTLVEGFANTLTFVAADALGNATTRKVTITFDAAAPPALAEGVLQADGDGIGTTVQLSWPTYVEPADLAYYRIYVSDAPFSSLDGLTPVGTAERGSQSYTVPDLTEGALYYFAVEPVDGTGNSETAIHIVARAPNDIAPPEDVTRLTAGAACSQADGHRLSLTWTASLDSRGDLAGQKLYVDNGSGYDQGTALAKDAVSHTLTGLTGNTVYKLRVTTLDAGGRESSGTVVVAATALANPTGVSAVPGKNQVALSWNAVSSPYVATYFIYRVAGDTPLSSVEGLTPIHAQTGTSLVNQNLENGVTYQYAVTVVNTFGAQNPAVQSVAATPRADAVPPVIGSFSLTEGQVVTNALTIEASATDDESPIAKLELHLDGVLVHTASGSPLSWYWNTLDTTDGNHVLKVVATDGSGNSAELERTIIVSQAPPATPQITGHSLDGATVALSGTAPLYTTVTLKAGTVVAATCQTDSAGHFSFSGLPVTEGDNPFAVKATHRGGDSPYSSDYVVTLDTGAPPAPVELAVALLSGGKLQFTWQAGQGEAPAGFNLYRASAPFIAVTDPGVTKTNDTPIRYYFKELTPADDSLYYYGVTALDGSGNESGLSNIQAVASDRSKPGVAEVRFAVNDGQPEAAPTTGPATVTVTFAVSEKLAETPFFSLEPQSGSPIVIAMSAIDDLHYRGSFRVDAASPHGATTWKFSGKDPVGNRGSGQGPGPVLDTQGPQASITAPLDLQQTVADVPVAISFDEAPVELPSLTFTDTAGTVAPVTGLIQDGDALHYRGSVDLSGLAEGQGSFQLVSAIDSFGNQSTAVASGKWLLLYEDTPPAPAVPSGLTAKSQSGGKIALLWKAVDGAVSYNLYRRAEGQSDWSLLANQTATVITDLPDTDGRYQYAVASLGVLDSESALTDPVGALSDRLAPAAPAGLTLELVGNGVQAAWSAPADSDVASYKLYRAASAITSVAGLTAAATADETAAIDTGARSDQRHYAVTAIDAVGNQSAPSADVSIDFPVAPVKSLALTRVENAAPYLAWQSDQPNLAGYLIYRNGSAVNSTPTVSTSYSDGYYTGGEVTYGIAVVDTFGNHSPIREATLPDLTVGVPDGTSLRRGLLEILPVEIRAAGELSVSQLALKVGSNAASTLAGPFAVAADAPATVEKVAATALDAGDTVPVLATATLNPAAGTTVAISQTSQVQVTGASTALEIFNEPLVRGTQAQVRLKFNNLGTARSEFLTSENGGATSQVRITLKDQDGNVLASGKLDQRTGSQIVNSSGYATARIEPGQSFLSEPIRFTVPASAPYKVVLEAVIANTWYHYNQPDQVQAPGLSQSVETTIADVSYTAVASVEKDTYRRGEAVEISGQALATADGRPMPNVPVRLGLSVKGFDRFYTVTTDEQGDFSYTYTPNSTEAGHYSVWAVHPDLSDRSVQDTFDILALTLNPAVFNLKLAKGGSYDVPFKLTNPGGAPLNELAFTVSASSGLAAAIVNPGATVLKAGEARSLKLRVTAQNDAPDNGYATVDIATAEGLTERLDVNVALFETIPVISVSPSYIDTGLKRGTQQVKTLTLTNKGQASLNNARIEGPSTSWMSLTVNAGLGSLAVGQKTAIGILFRPPATLAPGVYDDRIVIYSDNHIPYTINLQATVTSNAVGNVQFDVLNELLEDVAGAGITLQHQSLPELLYSLKTKADGTVTKFDIPEGRYAYHVSASGHKSYGGSFTVTPGLTVTVPVLLEVTLVEVEWSVTEITIEDRYEIKITQTFETNVPTAVLVVDPPFTNLPKMAVGEVYNGEFTITNHGLIAAQYEGTTYKRSFDGYELEVLGNIPATLGPNEKVIVPFRIKRVAEEE